MRTKLNRPVRYLCALGALLALAQPALAQSTAFSYQGQLKNGGSPANGSFPMTFKLYDALSGGSQQGSTLTFDGAGGNPPPVTVTNGLFSVLLDFGAGPFAVNQNRWLEIAVSGTTLSPRQQLTPTPFALNTRGINVSAAGNVGIGTNNPTSLLDVRGLLTLDSGADATVYTGTAGVELNRYMSLINSAVSPSASGLKAGGILCSDSYAYASPGKNDLIVKGRVGVGTPTLSYPLTIKTSSSFASYGWVHSDGTRELGSYVSSSGGWMGTKSNHPLYFFTNDSGAQATIDTNGALGVNTTSPSAWGQLTAFGNGRMAGYFEGNAGGVVAWSDNSGYTGMTAASGNGAGTGVYCYGDLYVTGNKAFQIDHPLDPENKYLNHYCAEGPEPLNVYRGNVMLDSAGQAWVALPDYFSEINRDPSYQLTPIGEPALVYVKEKLSGNRFLIAGGKPGMEISWRVEAVRHDRFVRDHGAVVEQIKDPQRRGTYLQPQLYGQPLEKGQFYRVKPQNAEPSRD